MTSSRVGCVVSCIREKDCIPLFFREGEVALPLLLEMNKQSSLSVVGNEQGGRLL